MVNHVRSHYMKVLNIHAKSVITLLIRQMVAPYTYFYSMGVPVFRQNFSEFDKHILLSQRIMRNDVH